MEDDEEQSDATPTLVVCSGEFTEQVDAIHIYICHRLTVLRLHTRTTLTKPYFYFHKPSLPPSSTSLLLQDPSTFTPSLLIALPMMSRVLLNPSCTPSACRVMKTFFLLLLPHFALP